MKAASDEFYDCKDWNVVITKQEKIIVRLKSENEETERRLKMELSHTERRYFRLKEDYYLLKSDYDKLRSRLAFYEAGERKRKTKERHEELERKEEESIKKKVRIEEEERMKIPKELSSKDGVK